MINFTLGRPVQELGTTKLVSLFKKKQLNLNPTIIISLDGDPGPVKLFGQLCLVAGLSRAAGVASRPPAEGSSGCFIN